MDQTTRYPRNQQAIVDLELYRVLQLLGFGLEHAVESFGLGYCSWKAIQNKASSVLSKRSTTVSDFSPFFTVLVVLQLVLDHVDHDLVAHKSTSVHDLLGFPSKLRLLCYLRSKHVPCCLK